MGKENKSRYAIMGMLALKPASGYQIKKLMEESTSNFWSESYGQIYPILKQLTENGLATSHTEKQDGKPERTIYTLTSQGKAELLRWLSEPVEEAPARIEILLKLFFGQLIPVEENISHIQQFQEIQQGLLRKYHGIEMHLHDCLRDESSDRVETTYALLTVRFGIHRCQALLAWCEESLATLHKLRDRSEVS
jgi:PadR family transcriptional regulator AphA